ncbi:MAG: DNA internalization-related competence protein ComEC/Rec2 [Betaproteobacteria bacterium]|nr:MAG: DNA internalization-related competence protein ComEC/Rec2 [Betaproteobacteria bacterium]
MRLLLLALAAALGAGWLQHQAQLPPLVYGLMVMVPALAGWSLGRQQLPVARHLSFACWLLACFVGGLFWAASQAYLALASELDERWSGRDVRIEGVIAQLTQPGQRGTRFVMNIERVLTVGAQLPRRTAITWYAGWSGDNDNVPKLLAGQRWQLTARLRPPHGNYNPHGFDIEARMLERGIRATGYVRDESSAQLITPLVWRPDYVVQRLRESVRQNLFAILGERQYAGILFALAVGDKRAITQEQWLVLTRTGTNHLMSISGLHITLVAGLVFGIVLRIWRRSVWLSTRVSPLRGATLCGFVAAVIYAALAGFAIPTQRAICMLAVVAASVWSGWRWPASAMLGAALFFVVALDPMAVTSAGFWLSFGAVAAILSVARSHGRNDGVVRMWARVQWSITIVLIPLLLVLFQQVSVVSPIANAVAIPLVSLCVAPLALLLIVVPLGLIATLAHEAVRLCFAVLEWLAALPGAVWQQHAPVVWTIPFAVAGVALIMLPRGFPGRILGVILLLPIFVIRPATPGIGELWLTVLDVGQGLSAVARTANHAVLFDTGPDYHGWSDAGRSIVVPYLRGEGISQLDLVIVSHDDIDHAGGTASVLSAFAAGQVVSSAVADSDLEGWRPSTRCQAGQAWTFDQVRFEILHPDAASYARDDIGDNDRSCVMRIESASGAVLLTADIERRSERRLLQADTSRLTADVLVAPHHGSATSSSEQFIAAVRPKLVLFPVGYANRYGHPHPEVQARYRSVGARLIRTDQSGAVIVRFDQIGTETATWRERKRRYWHKK